MGGFFIEGGRTLSGEVCVSGAKNAALPIAAAALLTEGAVIHNCPDLTDIRVSMDIISSLGCKCNLRSNVLTIEPYGMAEYEITRELCSKMRSSVTFLGALMGRMGQAVIYCPGGCVLGARPIDMHLDALEKMGAKISVDDGRISCVGKMRGADISLRYPSVGATENIILAAVLAQGTTLIKNAAREPEIVALADFLNAAGAKIYGAGSSEIMIEGVDRLYRCEYTVIGDRIEAGTFMCAAAATGGELFIKGADPCSFTALTDTLRSMGCVIKERRGLVYIDAPKRLSCVDYIKTAPYPAFPTDMQAQLTAVLCRAEGVSVVEEGVFEARSRHIAELKKMGADIECTDERHFEICGVKRLCGCDLYAGDLRGAAALVIAALAAEGKSVVHNISYIRRGYECFENKLSCVGAEIVAVDENFY